MSDLIIIAATIVFFAMCTIDVKWCDKIIGPDEVQTDAQNKPTYMAAVLRREGRRACTW